MVVHGHGALLTSAGATNIYPLAFTKHNVLKAHREATCDM